MFSKHQVVQVTAVHEIDNLTSVRNIFKHKAQEGPTREYHQLARMHTTCNDMQQVNCMGCQDNKPESYA